MTALSWRTSVSEAIGLFLEFGCHLAEPVSHRAVGTRTRKPQATLDLLPKIAGICHLYPTRPVVPTWKRRTDSYVPAFLKKFRADFALVPAR
jgi:hypothetical protein